MGVTSSINVADMVSESIMRVAAKTAQENSAIMDASISIGKNTVIIGSSFNTSIDAIQKGLANFKIDNKMITDIMNDLQSQADSEADVGAAISANVTYIKQTLENSLNVEMIQRCGMNLKASIVVEEGAYIEGSDLVSTIKATQNCIKTSLLSNENFQTMSNDIELEASSAVSAWLAIGMVLLVLIIGVGAYFYFSSSSVSVNFQNKPENQLNDL